jgi:hypothetical protein
LFIGHFAVGYAAKRLAPRTSLGVLIAAPLFLDMVWPLFLELGWERVRIAPGNTAFTPLDFEWYPWSHSLLLTVVWSLAAAGVVWRWKREKRVATVVGLLVFSHWVLDFVTHGPDLPIDPGGRVRVGLGLWNYPVATMVIESLMYVAGVWLYLRSTHAMDRLGRWVLGSFIVATYGLYLMASFGPPPPSARALAASAFGVWLFPAWAWWADRHRAPAALSTPYDR